MDTHSEIVRTIKNPRTAPALAGQWQKQSRIWGTRQPSTAWGTGPKSAARQGRGNLCGTGGPSAQLRSRSHQGGCRGGAALPTRRNGTLQSARNHREAPLPRRNPARSRESSTAGQIQDCSWGSRKIQSSPVPQPQRQLQTRLHHQPSIRNRMH